MLIVLQCQKVFSVVEFEQKLRERQVTRVTRSTLHLLQQLLHCEVYQQPGQDVHSVLRDAACICINSCAWQCMYVLHIRSIHVDTY